MKLPFSNEKLFNLLFGLNIFGWGIAGIFFSSDTELSPVRVCITSINVIVGLLIFFRKKAIVPTMLLSSPHWFIVLFCNGYLFRLAQPLSNWSIYTEGLFIFGSIFTIISFMFLGSNFSIRPSVRGVSTRGTYKIVRHPAYLGEALMALACVIASPHYYAFLIYFVLMAFQVWRINEEESMLRTLPAYVAFAEKTNWRLIPFIW